MLSYEFLRGELHEYELLALDMNEFLYFVYTLYFLYSLLKKFVKLLNGKGSLY